MFKVMIMIAVVSAIAASSIPLPLTKEQPSVPTQLPVLMRQSRAAEMPTEPKEVQSAQEVESGNDMEKAETFGFGFHKHIYVAPSYGYGSFYPSSYGNGYLSYVYGYPY